MASSSQESRIQNPVEIKFGDFPPVPLTNLEIQKPPPSQLRSGLSPQLRFSLSRKQPVSQPSSRIFSPSPVTLELNADGSYYKVPSKWCPDNKVWSRDLYLSRTSLLKKMIHQRILYRTLEPVFPSFVDDNHDDDDDVTSGIEILGSPIDYWVTMPIHPPPIGQENADPPELKNVSLNEIEGISIGFATGPMKPSRYALNRLFGYGPEPDNDGRPFPWVTNPTGTRFLDRSTLMSLDIEHILGFVECPICKAILCVGYLVPTRIDMVNIEWDPIGRKFRISGRNTPVGCSCEISSDGMVIPSRPIISDNLNKINWVFLFLGVGIGLCSIDQLRYYCYQRKKPISDTKEKLFASVLVDVCLQITGRRVVRA